MVGVMIAIPLLLLVLAACKKTESAKPAEPPAARSTHTIELVVHPSTQP